MTFLNASLLFGLLAAAAPVVLHLLSRREPQKVVFPSIRFLTQRYETNRSRMKIRRWWLLALRIAAIAAVALVFARPMIHQSLSLTWLTIAIVALCGVGLLVLSGVAFSQAKPAALKISLLAAALVLLLASLIWGVTTYATGTPPPTDAQSPVAMAIVIDNSATSSWKTLDDDRIVRIHDLADWLVSRVPRRSRIAILDRSSAPPSFALDAASAIAQVEGKVPLAVAQPIEARIDAAIRLLRTSDLPSRTVVVISDLSENTWSEVLDSPSLAERIAAEPAVTVTLFDLGPFNAINRRLSAINVSDSTPPASAPVAISADVSLNGAFSAGNGGGEGVTITAELEMIQPDPALPLVRDGVIERPTLRVVDRVSTRIRGTGSSELVLNVPPLKVGTHHGRVRLVGDDPLQMDDVRFFTLSVLPASPVLIVCDSQEEARVIGQTITSPFMIDDPNAEYRVETIGYRDFDVVELSDYQAVLLLDPSNEVMLSDRLKEYFADGGGVLAALGPSAAPSRDSTASADPKASSDLLPPLLRRWRVPTPGSFLQLSENMHPATLPLTRLPSGVPWNEFRVFQYWQIRPQPLDRELARYAGTQHPALIERKFLADDNNTSSSRSAAAGRLLIMTTPLPALTDTTRTWNELFSAAEAWPAFLLVRQIADYLTNRSADSLTMQVGNPLTMSFDRLDSNLGSTSTVDSANPVVNAAEVISEEELRRSRLQLFPPGDSAAIPIDIAPDATNVTLTNILSPGTYWLRGDGLSTGFSANVAEQVTRLERIDPEKLSSIFPADSFTIVTAKEQIDLSGDSASQRVALHSPAMLIALIIFLLEQILSNRFYRRRQASAARVADLGAKG